MVTLKNERMELSIAEHGAEIRRLLLDGKDVMWNGDPAVWTGVSPVLFPMCGGLKENKYTLDGVEYTLAKHGFARHSHFAVESRGVNRVTFLLTDDEETYVQFPFHFELRITYLIRGTAVEVQYEVRNRSDHTMYYSIGSHEAYACPEGIEDYDIIFPQNETLNAYETAGALLSGNTVPILKDGNVLPLYKKYFDVDALIFKDVRSRSVTLRNRKTGRAIGVSFPDCRYLLIWTKPAGDYICIEPWCGIPAKTTDGIAIEEKEGIETLDAGQKKTYTHTFYL